MAVEVEDFIGVGGYFDAAELWPGVEAEALSDRFQAWIDKAVTLPPVVALATTALRDTAVTQRVMYRGWDNIYQFRLGNPASVTVDNKGSHGFTQGQIDAAKAERDAALAAYEDVVAKPPAGAPVARQSASVRAEFSF